MLRKNEYNMRYISIMFVFLILLFIPQHSLHAEPLFPVNINGKYGFIDKNGNVSIGAIYDHVTNFNENGQAVVMYSGKKGVINTSGVFIIHPIYDDIGNISEDSIPIKVGNAWTYINIKGFQTIYSQYIDAKEFSDGVAVVKIDTYGFFDKNGKFQSNNNKYGYINHEGKIVLYPIYDNALNFSNGITCVRDATHWRVINKNGISLNDNKYEECNKVESGRVHLKYLDKISYSKKYVVLDNVGRILIDGNMDEIGLFREGHYVIYSTNFLTKSGIYEKTGGFIYKGDLHKWGMTEYGTVYRQKTGEATFYEPEKKNCPRYLLLPNA